MYQVPHLCNCNHPQQRLTMIMMYIAQFGTHHPAAETLFSNLPPCQRTPGSKSLTLTTLPPRESEYWLWQACGSPTTACPMPTTFHPLSRAPLPTTHCLCMATPSGKISQAHFAMQQLPLTTECIYKLNITWPIQPSRISTGSWLNWPSDDSLWLIALASINSYMTGYHSRVPVIQHPHETATSAHTANAN